MTDREEGDAMESSSLSHVQNVLRGVGVSLLESQSSFSGTDLDASKEFAEAVKFGLEWAADADEEGLPEKNLQASGSDGASTKDDRYPMCSQVLTLIHEVCVQTRNEEGESLLEFVAWDIIQPMLPYACLSQPCCAAFSAIIQSMARECSAREMFTLFMEVLHMADGYSFSPWPLRASLLQGFTVLFPRILRRRAEFLEEALPVFINLANEASSTCSGGQQQQKELMIRGMEDDDGQSLEEDSSGLHKEGRDVHKLSSSAEEDLQRQMKEETLYDMAAFVEMLVTEFLQPEATTHSQGSRLQRLTAALTLHLIGVASVSIAARTSNEPAASAPSSLSSLALPSSSSLNCPFSRSPIPRVLVSLYRSLYDCGFSANKLLSGHWVRQLVTDVDIVNATEGEEEEEDEEEGGEGCDIERQRRDWEEENFSRENDDDDDDENEGELSDDGSGAVEVEVGQGLGAAVALYHGLTNEECGAILGVTRAQEHGAGDLQSCYCPVLSLEKAVKVLELARLMLVCSTGANRIAALSQGMELIAVAGKACKAGKVWGGDRGDGDMISHRVKARRGEDYLKTVMPVLKALQFPLVFTPVQGLRKAAVDAIQSCLGILPPRQRFRAIRKVIASCPYSAIRALYFTFAKDEFMRASDSHRLWSSRGKSVASNSTEITPGRERSPPPGTGKLSPFLSGTLLQLVRDVLQCDAGRGVDVDDVLTEADVMIGALNLFLFVILREFSAGTHLTGVQSLGVLTEARQSWLLPLRHLAGMAKASMVEKVEEEGGCKNDLQAHLLHLDILLNVLHRVLEVVESEMEKRQIQGDRYQ